jgi:DNA adenine methylase
MKTLRAIGEFSITKSPLNYIGGKYKILKQILPLFPKKINTFVDLFAGGCDVGLNVSANKVYFNDNLSFLIEMYKAFQRYDVMSVICHIEARIIKYNLSNLNQEGYIRVRELYNQHKHPLDLFVLIAYSFNHQIRFNNNHQFNNPFGKERSSFNNMMKQNLISFVSKIKQRDVEFFCKCFTDFDFSKLQSDDFVYCDPPYLITTGTYNDGKRGFNGWSKKEEIQLLNTLDDINKREIKFALSNVLHHKGKTNEILNAWLSLNPQYEVNVINKDYSNSNYQTLDKSKNSSLEVLVTNYIPEKLENYQLFSI